VGIGAAHNGLRDRGTAQADRRPRTTFLVTEGAGPEEGPAFITLNTNSTIKGVVLYYPEQNWMMFEGVSLGRSPMRGRTRLSLPSRC